VTRDNQQAPTQLQREHTATEITKIEYENQIVKHVSDAPMWATSLRVVSARSATQKPESRCRAGAIGAGTHLTSEHMPLITISINITNMGHTSSLWLCTNGVRAHERAGS
jgi:hypothetical protein